MTVDPEIVQERLHLMNALLADLDEIGEVTAGRLEHERLIRHAVERIVTQLVELAVSINNHIVASLKGEMSATYRESFKAAAKVGAIDQELAAALEPSAGLRNILTHEYITVDLAIVAASVPLIADLYRQYTRSVAAYLQR